MTQGPVSLIEVLKRTADWFGQRSIPAPQFEAEQILAHVLHIPRLHVYLQHDRPMEPAELQTLRELVARRGRREPLAWILGEQGFHEIDLGVGPGVLVPRPDTEAVVNAALEWLKDSKDPTYLADVGCGSGAIGLALAHVVPHLRVYATDIASAAIDTTRRNVAQLGLGDRVAVLQGDLLSAIPDDRPIDWVLSNPPYIPTDTIPTLQPEVSEWEPREALDGGKDGLDFYRKLIPLAATRASQGMIVEVGAGQAEQVQALFEQGGWTQVTVWQDLGSIERVVGGRVPVNDG